jgi:hypothetical protein
VSGIPVDQFSILFFQPLLRAFLKNLIDQIKAKPDPPLILMIDSRLNAVTGPEEISKALCDAVVSENLIELAQLAFGAFAGLALSSLVLVNAPGAEVSCRLFFLPRGRPLLLLLPVGI